MAQITLSKDEMLQKPLPIIDDYDDETVSSGFKKLFGRKNKQQIKNIEALEYAYNQPSYQAISNINGSVVANTSVQNEAGASPPKLAGAMVGNNLTPNAKVEASISAPAAVVINPNGLPTDNHLQVAGGIEYNIGSLPTNKEEKLNSNTPQAVEGVAQVLSVKYPREIALEQDTTSQITPQEQEQVAQPREGMPEGYWQKRVMQDRGKENNINKDATSGNAIFEQATAENNIVNFTRREEERNKQRELEAATQGAKMT
jgi:hypothetical protein